MMEKENITIEVDQRICSELQSLVDKEQDSLRHDMKIGSFSGAAIGCTIGVALDLVAIFVPFNLSYEILSAVLVIAPITGSALGAYAGGLIAEFDRKPLDLWSQLNNNTIAVGYDEGRPIMKMADIMEESAIATNEMLIDYLNMNHLN